MIPEALTFACPNCAFVLTEELVRERRILCRVCGSRIEPEIFSALFRRDENHAHEIAMGEEATCYFHADRVAAFMCTRCGRFLCPLCRIAWAGEDVCASCLEAAARGKEGAQLASDRFHYDSLALTLSTAGLLTGFLSILTAPFALGFSLFTFRRECSIAPRSKIRFILAIVFSLATIAGWTIFFVYAFRQRTVFAPPGQIP